MQTSECSEEKGKHSHKKDVYYGTSLYGKPVLDESKNDWYKVILKTKRNGKKRLIEAPEPWLKEKQRTLLDKVLSTIPVAKTAYGCVRWRNVQKAASPHLGKKYLVTIDLKDCFHSIDSDKVISSLVFTGVKFEDASKIAWLCTNKFGVLPQGAPTSPHLANIVMLKMYAGLSKFSSANNMVFTGYLDDLIFSSDDEEIFSKVKYLLKIIEFYKFTVNIEKIKMFRSRRQVLSVCVAPGSDSTRLPKIKRNMIRGALHSLERKIINKDIERKDALHEYHKLHGLVSFSEMVKDPKYPVFKEKVMGIRKLLY